MLRKFLVLAFMLAFFAACNNNATSGVTDNEAGASPPWSEDETPGGPGSAPGVPEDAPRDPVTITYANWNLGLEEENNLERRMLAAFMDAYPWITVEIDDRITGDWMEALTIASTTQSLPDVFMLNDQGAMIINGWLMDITEVAMDDPEFAALPSAILQSTQINNRVFSIPFAQFMIGFFVNRDIFNSLNLDPPTFGVSVEDFISLTREVTDLNRPIVGLNHATSFAEWMPGNLDRSLGFFAYQNGTYALNSPAMLQTIALAAELTTTGYTFEGLTPDQREAFVGGWGGEVFRDDGTIALLYDGTWLMNFIQEGATFDWDFIGAPGGRTVVTIDITGVASTSAHPYEAFLLAKFMGFGADGYLRRAAIANEMGAALPLPVSTDSRVIAAFRESIPVPGLLAAIDNLGDALIDGNKIIPGHVPARFTAPTGISIPGTDIDNASMGDAMHHSQTGALNFPAHADALAAIAAEQLSAAMALLSN